MTDDPRDLEIARLNARVSQLESELLEHQRRTNTLVAEAQQRLYWLERWHIDINELMARPGADTFREAVRLVRAGFRRARNAKRRLIPR